MAALLLLFLLDVLGDLFKPGPGPNIINGPGVVIAPHNQVVVTDVHGNTTHHYVPPEGSVTITTTTVIVTPATPQHPAVTATVVSVKVKDWGTCKRLGIGLTYIGRILPQLDLKLVYWRRYSATAGVNTEYINIGVYRHVDDLIGFDNLEFGINGGIGFDGSRRAGMCLRLNL
jgi:hypothetical protein